MTDLMCKVALKSVTGMVEDDAVIDLVYTTPTALGSVVFSDLGGVIASFFNTATSTTFDVATYVSGDVSRVGSPHEVNFYDLTGHLDGTPLGSPVGTYNFSLDAADVTSVPLPSEVAVALSFNADLTDVPEKETNPTPPPAFFRPAARRRGRVFIGPLNTACLSGDNPSLSRPGEVMMNTLVESGSERLGAAALALTDDFVWSVWSRTDELLRPVVEVSVDNAFDTIRSRGVAPTYRTTVGV